MDQDTDFVHVRVGPPNVGRGSVRLTIAGELDGTVAPQLLDVVTDALAQWQPRMVEFDLAAVTFLDSAGIRCLFDCRQATLRANSDLILATPAPEVHRVLEIVGLLEEFGLPPTSRRGSLRPFSSRF